MHRSGKEQHLRGWQAGGIQTVFQEIPRDGILMGKPHSHLCPHDVNKAQSQEGQDMTIPWESWGTQTLATVATLYV